MKNRKEEEITKTLNELYLNEDLQGLAKALGRTVVTAGYVCDRDNDGIATKEVGGAYVGLKNELDWGLFQRLIAHADAIITGADYLERVRKMGPEKAQNVLNQFSDGKFKFLGDWRESHGLKRNPDILVMSRSLDVYIPEGVMEGGRKVLVFTTNSSSNSDKAARLRDKGVVVIDAGNEKDDGVDGNRMYKYLNEIAHYKVVKIVTGPRALKVQMDAKKLLLLYVDRVDKDIPGDSKSIVPILAGGGILSERTDLRKIRSIKIKKVKMNDGSEADIDFETWIYTNLSKKEENEVLQRVRNLN